MVRLVFIDVADVSVDVVVESAVLLMGDRGGDVDGSVDIGDVLEMPLGTREGLFGVFLRPVSNGVYRPRQNLNLV